MSENIIKAKEKIDKELKEFKGGSAATVVSKYIAETLKKFSENEKFADAIIMQEKNLTECCEQVVKGAGKGISDIEAYRKAAEFYFPGAKVEFKMEITVDGELTQADETVINTQTTEKPPIVKVKKPEPKTSQKENKSNVIQLTFF